MPSYLLYLLLWFWEWISHFLSQDNHNHLCVFLSLLNRLGVTHFINVLLIFWPFSLRLFKMCTQTAALTPTDMFTTMCNKYIHEVLEMHKSMPKLPPQCKARITVYSSFSDKAQRVLNFQTIFLWCLICHWTSANCNLLFRGCRRGWHLTLHWHRVHSVPCLIQEEPLKREMLCSSVHVLVMSLRMVSARQGSVTQRGQHSPSGTTVNSQSTGGHGRGQQSTCPCCGGEAREYVLDRNKVVGFVSTLRGVTYSGVQKYTLK